MEIKNIYYYFGKLNRWFDKKFNTSWFSSSSEDDKKNPYKNWGIKLFLFFSLLIFLTLIFPSGISFQYANLKIGMIAQEKIESSFTFPILKTPEELNEERNHVMRSVEEIFEKDTSVYEIEIIKFKNLISKFLNIYEQLPELKKQILFSDTMSEKSTMQIDSILYEWKIQYDLILNKRQIKTLFDLKKSKRLNLFENRMTKLFKDVYTKGIIDVPRYKLLNDIIVVKGKTLSPEMFYHLSEAIASLKRRSSEIFRESSIVELVIPIVEAFCKPNLFYQAKETKQKREKIQKEVPLTKGFVYEGQMIIDNAEIVTPEIYNTLHSFATAQAEKGLLSANKREWFFKIGIYLISALLISIFTIFIFVYRNDTFNNNYLLFLIYLIFIIQFSINFLFVKILNWSPLTMPIVLLPMMLTMLLDSKTAFTGTFISAFFTAAMIGMDIYFAFYTITTGVAVIFSTRRLRRRTDSIKAVAIVFFVYALTYFALGFLRFAAFTELIKELLLPFVTTIFAMFIFYMVIPLFEKMFDLVTDITLLELSDLNSPLLKKLSIDAPGTFNHSLIMGNLAETAAESIDANPLLARVGCYYHDIGKMERPEYFIENQMGAMNRHESLQPNMSALILSNHVKIGLKLASKYKLPTLVKRFIPEHHGTSRMEYFYHKAKELADNKELDDEDFRYPGPKPGLRETAIAMIADNIEAAVRSLKNPTPNKISQMVNELVNKKFSEGELENCDLTLTNLTTIKDALIPLLIGTHHHRIEYPKDEPIKPVDKKDVTQNPKVVPEISEKPKEEKKVTDFKIIESKDIKDNTEHKE